jgi:hypothetical protein
VVLQCEREAGQWHRSQVAEAQADGFVRVGVTPGWLGERAREEHRKTAGMG